MNEQSGATMSYLGSSIVATHLHTVELDPAASEAKSRRATTAILRWLFREDEGYDVVRGDDRGDSVPDFVVLKMECGPGGGRRLRTTS